MAMSTVEIDADAIIAEIKKQPGAPPTAAALLSIEPLGPPIVLASE